MQLVIGINEEALAEWVEYRTEKGKPLSPLALKKTQNVMLKYDEAQQQVMVDAAIMNDWQGLHAVDPPKDMTHAQNRLGSYTGTNQQKLTPAQRTAAKREALRAGRPALGVVATNG